MRTPLTTLEWKTYFEENSINRLPIPWHKGGLPRDPATDVVLRSLAVWQLGETSEGKAYLATAMIYAQAIDDPHYVDVVKMFTIEEQRHGAMMGHFLDACQFPRVETHWGDTVFRGMRHFLLRIEIWTTVVLVVETLALVYYHAILNATTSPVLKAICQQILKDEVFHLRFQYERLAILHANRPRWLRLVTLQIQQALFFGTLLVVWAGHRRALLAGGFTFRRYVQTAWKRMSFHWSKMNPERWELTNGKAFQKEDNASPSSSRATSVQRNLAAQVATGAGAGE